MLEERCPNIDIRIRVLLTRVSHGAKTIPTGIANRAFGHIVTEYCVWTVRGGGLVVCAEVEPVRGAAGGVEVGEGVA